MKTVLHRAETRGHANHGWLDARHSFSFANYYDPHRMNFGVLRVLNDDTIAAGKGFGMHPHENMEIITLPLEGDLEHKDNIGNSSVIKEGDIQVMSAGTGVLHSEFNKNADISVKLLQIWIYPNKKNVKPRYNQMSIRDIAIKNEFYQILSPNKEESGVWIHQNVWFTLGDFDEGHSAIYKLNDGANGIYAFVIDGEIEINGQSLNKRDGFGVWDVNELTITARRESRILIMEVPVIL